MGQGRDRRTVPPLRFPSCMPATRVEEAADKS